MIAEIDGEDVEIPALDDEAPDTSDAPIAIRVWEPFPGRHIEADSPARASLHLLEQFQLLNAAISAIVRSQITGRGCSFPRGTRFPTQPGQAGDTEDDLIEIFLEVAATAIREPDSAAATVPMVLEVPPGSISDIKGMSFDPLPRSGPAAVADHRRADVHRRADRAPRRIPRPGADSPCAPTGRYLIPAHVARSGGCWPGTRTRLVARTASGRPSTASRSAAASTPSVRPSLYAVILTGFGDMAKLSDHRVTRDLVKSVSPPFSVRHH
ncbi:hypothetical protein ABZ586_09305 [Streptomyces misionensis]